MNKGNLSYAPISKKKIYGPEEDDEDEMFLHESPIAQRFK